MRKIYFVAAIILSFFRLPFCLGQQLTLGDKLIEHYQAERDKEKIKAAYFLLENINYHYSDISQLIERKFDDLLIIPNTYKYPASIKQYNKIYNNNIEDTVIRKNDKDVLSVQDMIDNIDLAFDDWRYGEWAKHLSFKDFCEILLPYRVANEKFEPSRRYFKDNFYKYAVRYNNCDERRKSPYWAAYSICNILRQNKFHVDDRAMPRSKVELPLTLLFSMNMGDCYSYAKLTAQIMRSCGIPVCVDFVPQWPNKANRHAWNSLIDNTGKCVPFLGGESLPGNYGRYGQKLGKVYRLTYSYNKLSAASLANQFGEIVPQSLSNPFTKDVSNDYFQGVDISVKLLNNELSRKLAYLAVFDNKRWIPITHGIVNNNEVFFSNIQKGIVYMVVYWGRNGAIPCSNPFLVDERGDVHKFEPNMQEMIPLVIDRKYPIFGRIYDFSESFVGGQIQASDSASFARIDTVLTIDKSPSPWMNKYKFTKKVSRRYWRYKAPVGSNCNVAEFSFINKTCNQPIKEFLCDDMKYNGKKKTKAFDGNYESYYESIHSRGAWIGVDFGEPVTIDEISIMPRNDDNHIVSGHLYKLCYFSNGEEIEVGTQMAIGDYLKFEGVPSGTVYIVHDLTAGKEERIFCINNNRIDWY